MMQGVMGSGGDQVEICDSFACRPIIMHRHEKEKRNGTPTKRNRTNNEKKLFLALAAAEGPGEATPAVAEPPAPPVRL